MRCPHTNIVRNIIMPSGETAYCDACGQPSVHSFEVQYKRPIRLCSGCNFKFTVMRAAGREYEFLASLYRYAQEWSPEYPRSSANPYGDFW
jgi:hypothetical protein